LVYYLFWRADICGKRYDCLRSHSLFTIIALFNEIRAFILIIDAEWTSLSLQMFQFTAQSLFFAETCPIHTCFI